MVKLNLFFRGNRSFSAYTVFSKFIDADNICLSEGKYVTYYIVSN